jgi:hypothetical protein
MPTISGVSKKPDNTSNPEVLFERFANIISGSNTVSRDPVRAVPSSSTGAFSTTLLAGFYRYYPNADQPFFYEIEVTSSNADVKDISTDEDGSSTASRATYFATLAAAKAHDGYTEDRTFWIKTDGAFMGGAFTYSASSSATADDSDTIALDSIAGRLIRFA